MKGIKNKLSILTLILLSLCIIAGNVWSEVNLPYAKFAGAVQTTPGIGTGALTVQSIVITQLFYLDSNGVPTQQNTPGVETLIGKPVKILGATRTGDYTFSNATISIGDAANTYFTATMSNIEFVQVGNEWALNPLLDSSVPSTLNISDITFPGNRTTHPSRYIDELEQELIAASTTTAGLKMKLKFVFPAGSDITGFGIATITEGILDGSPDVSNTAPVANAGVNVSITSTEISSTTILGAGTDADIGDTLQYRWIWMEQGTVLLDWTPVGSGGECPLDLSTLSIGIGTYTLTLEVKDALETADADNMFLEIDNSAPHAQPGGGGIYEVNTEVILDGDVSDFDGDLLLYEWSEGSNLICDGDIQALAEGLPVELPSCAVSNLSLGLHTITLTANDGLNLPATGDVSVEIVDTTVPTIAPLASQYIMWPPNHIMVDIAIEANAADNSGLPVSLSATIASNEPEDGLGDGDTGPDWTVPVIDQSTGMINFQLRRERSGTGNGRKYTITITAEDNAGNTSTTAVEIGVPHDMRKKK